MQETLQCPVANQTTQVPVPTPATPVIEPILDEPVQGTTPVNANNLSAARWPASLSEEPAVRRLR